VRRPPPPPATWLLDVYGSIVKLLGELATREGDRQYVAVSPNGNRRTRRGLARHGGAVLKALVTAATSTWTASGIDFLKPLPARG